MALPTGTRLGPYEILGPLGAGGMGEVYSARDARLDRAVAIKVLPEQVASDPRLRQRFEREARALAALSHPHICTLHDVGEQDGVSFLVMERLEGETLASRLAKGALPLAQVTRVGSQIAAALDQAHRRGVVHRDVKPANVMLTREGAKLLDFGLARPAVDLLASPAGDLSRLPTASQPLTTNHELVGTIPYMAPEQLEGREPDARTDIFALGAVLHEMATGRRAFVGESVASVIAAILTAQPPPLSSLEPLAPAALERAVSRCLAKDPESRWQSARDLQLELEWVDQAGGTEASAARAPRARIRERLAWLAAAGSLAVALALAIARLDGPAPAPQAAARFTLAPPAGNSYTFARVSPDGRNLSFTALGTGDQAQIWLRPLEDPSARPLPGTEGAGRHFWSPDSRFIAFFAEGKLKRVEVTGGPARVLCEAPGAGPFRQGAWSRDGTILFRVDEAPGHREGLFRVPASGGVPVPLDPVDESGRAMQVAWPSFLPDGRRFVGPCTAEGDGPERAATCVVTLETGRASRLLDIPSYAEYAPPGFLVYVEGTSLLAQPFDAESLRLGGEPARIADGMESWGGVGVPAFSVSANGVLVYLGVFGGQSRLLWKDRSGGDLGEVGPRGVYHYVRLAPDGRRAVATLRHPQHGVSELWIVDLERRVSTRFTPESPDTLFPVWSPDGSRMAYCRPRNGPPSLHVKPLGGGADRVLLPAAGAMQCASDWSADGRHLLFTERHPGTGMDIWLLATDSARPPTPLVRTPFREHSASFSPDTRWFAYSSDESGQPEIYVQPFPGPGERIRVSVEGGTLPRWRRDGGELYYLDASERLVAVPVGRGSTLQLGAPTPLFRPETGGRPGVAGRYDVSADGQRFLVIAPEPDAAPGATVVLDWPATLSEGEPD